MAPALGAIRVLIAVSPPLLAETIARIIRRSDLLCDIVSDPIRLDAPVAAYAVAITDGFTLPAATAELVITLPPAPDAPIRPRSGPPQRSRAPVVQVASLAEMTEKLREVTARPA